MKRSFQKQLSKIISFLSSMIFLALFSSCGGKQGETVATVQIFQGVAQLQVQYALGGLVLFGRSDNGSAFSRVVDISTGQVELTLPNGTWVFSSIAWSGTNSFEGDVRCGASQPTKLEGADLNLNLSLTNAGCDTPGFAGSIGMNGTGTKTFANTNFFSCQDLSFDPTTYGTILLKQAICNDSPTTSPSKISKGHLGSIKVVVDNFDILRGNFVSRNGPNLESTCLRIDSANPYYSMLDRDSSNAVTSFNLPTGNGTLGLAFKVIGYFDNNTCGASTNGDKVFNFPFGMSSPHPSVAKFHDFTISGPPSTKYQNVYLRSTDQDVCSGARLSGTTAPAGAGTVAHPFVICTKAQFNAISDYAKTYRLGADLDYQYGTGVNNITLIGGTSPTAFTGRFLGNNHKISKVRFSLPASSNYFGVFRRIGTGAIIANLILDKIEMLGDGTNNYVGILSGDISNGATIRSVFVTDSLIKANNYVGFIAGEVAGTPSSFNQVHGYGVIKAFNYVGGLFGQLNFSAFSPVSVGSFHGDIKANQYVGGVIGKLNTTSGTITLSGFRSSGRAVGQNNIGGIIGDASSVSSSVTLMETYSLMNVSARGLSNSYAGGLVGFGGSTNFSVIKSFQTLGAIYSGDPLTYGGIFGSRGTSQLSVAQSSTFYTATSGSSQDSSNFLPIYDVSNPHIRSNSAIGSSGGIGTIVSTLPTAPGNMWFKPSGDNNYDFPQLVWEKEFENNLLPHLKRQCSGLFSTQAGAGTSISPYTVCNSTQFVNMSSGNYYILKTDIDLSDQVPTGVFKIASFNYSLDGDNHFISNMKISTAASFTGNAGYIATMTSAGVLKNVKIYAPSFTTTAGLAGSFNQGMLVGRNNGGKIENVLMDDAIIDYSGSASVTTSGIIQNRGGLVGYNQGQILNSKVFGILKFNSIINFSSGDATVSTGGIVGYNHADGVISKVANGLGYTRTLGSAGTSLTTYIGGIAGFNEGSIDQVKNFSLINNQPNTTTAFNIYIGGIAGKNTGDIFDTFVLSTFTTNINGDGNIGGLVGFNAGGGTISRSFYQDRAAANSFYSGSNKGGLVGAADTNSGNTYTDLFCYDGTVYGNRFDTTTGLASASGTKTNVISACFTGVSLPSKTYASGTVSFNSTIFTTNFNYGINNTLVDALYYGDPWLFRPATESTIFLDLVNVID